MKAYNRFAVLIIALLFFLSGCNSASTDPLSNLTIPDSGYQACFAPVEGAVLYVDGVPQKINVDDPRLIRVLNFLAHAKETMQYSWTQGFVYEEEINQYYSSDATMLEVTFAVDAVSDQSIHRDTPKILISGDTYILFVDSKTMNNGIEEIHAERHWPYEELAPEGATQSNTDLSWGGDYWLDILEYCGF